MKIGEFNNCDFSNANAKAEALHQVPEKADPLSWSNLKIYNIEIQEVSSSDNIPPTWFSILDYKVAKTVLELLIEYHSNGHPEIQALKDLQTGKLFLTGGKIDTPLLTETSRGTHLTLAKSNRAHVSMDLFSLGKIEELNIYKKLPPTFIRMETVPYASIKILEASDDLLFTLKWQP